MWFHAHYVKLSVLNVLKNRTCAKARLSLFATSALTPQQFADCLIAKPCKVADVYDKSPQNDFFIKGVGASFKHSRRKYWEKRQ